MRWLVLLIAIGFGIARLTMPVVSEIHRDDIFKDMAHLFVGSLFGAAIALQSIRFSVSENFGQANDSVIAKAMRRYLFLAVAMTILEVVAFIIHKP